MSSSLLQMASVCFAVLAAAKHSLLFSANSYAKGCYGNRLLTNKYNDLVSRIWVMREVCKIIIFCENLYSSVLYVKA